MGKEQLTTENTENTEKGTEENEEVVRAGPGQNVLLCDPLCSLWFGLLILRQAQDEASTGSG
jgi:hypothetical protein